MIVEHAVARCSGQSLMAFLIASVILLPCSYADAASSWSIDAVVDGNTIYWMDFANAVAVDSRNIPHVVFNYDHDSHRVLRYGVLSDGEWTFSEIATNVGVSFCSIAIDPDDKVNVAYYDDGQSQVYYATVSNGLWSVGPVGSWEWSWGSVSYASIVPSLALDRQGHPYIAVHTTDGNSSLKIYSNLNGTWGTEVVPSLRNVSIPYIAFDSSNVLHVIYQKYLGEEKVIHAWRTGGSWTNETLNLTKIPLTWMLSTGIDSRDRVHLCYVALSNGQESDYGNLDYCIMHAWKHGDSWSEEVAYPGPSLSTMSMAISSEDVLQLSFQDSLNTDLMYASNAGGHWTAQRVDSVDYVGYRSSIALGPANQVHILYFNETGMSVKYATGSGALVGENAGVSGLLGASLVVGSAVVAFVVGMLLGRIGKSSVGRPDDSKKPPPPPDSR